MSRRKIYHEIVENMNNTNMQHMGRGQYAVLRRVQNVQVAERETNKLVKRWCKQKSLAFPWIHVHAASKLRQAQHLLTTACQLTIVNSPDSLEYLHFSTSFLFQLTFSPHFNLNFKSLRLKSNSFS